MIEPFNDIEDARALAQAIVDTVREPLLVLDGDLRVLAVSRSYYLTFRVDRQDVLGRPLYALGDGQWQIPALRILLEKIIPERAAMDAFEVEHEFPMIGRRVMLLNARAVFYAGSADFGYRHHHDPLQGISAPRKKADKDAFFCHLNWPIGQ